MEKTAKEIVDQFGEHRDELKQAVDEMKCIECRAALKMLIDSVITEQAAGFVSNSVGLMKHDLRRIVKTILREEF